MGAQGVNRGTGVTRETEVAKFKYTDIMTTDITATDQQNEQKPIVIESWVSLGQSGRGVYGLGNPKWWFGPGKWLPDKYRIPRWLYRYTKRLFEEYLLHGYDSDDLSLNSYDSSSSGSSDSSEKNGNNTEETVIVKPPAANGNNTEETGIVKPPAAKTFERVKDENGYTKWQAWLPENELFRPPTTENKQVEFRLRATVWAYGMFSFGRHSNPSHAPNAGLGAYNDRLGERQTPRNVPGSIVNDTTVGVDGRLTEQRLDRCLDHLPIVATQKKKCALHRWLGFRKEGKNLLYCRACNVTLCSACYDDFHKVKDLTEIKYWLKQECLERQETPRKGYWNENENLEENWPREDVMSKRCLTSQEVIDRRMNNFK